MLKAADIMTVAWDVVEALESEIGHQQAKKVFKTALDDSCDESPEMMPT